MFIYRSLIIVSAVTGWLLLPSSAIAVGSSIEVNTFTFPGDFFDETANDFHLRITNGAKLTKPDTKPKPDQPPKLPNVSQPDTNQANFSGATLNKGDVLNVRFESDVAKNRPQGFFTLNGSRVSDDIKSLGLDGEELSFVPQDGGFLASVTLINPFETSMAGSVIAYVNAGLLSDQFTVDLFDTLNHARPFFSDPNLSLTSMQVLSLPTIALTPDDYILITGLVGVGGPLEPFSLGFSPGTVPEPSTWLLFGSGLAGIVVYGRKRLAKKV